MLAAAAAQHYTPPCGESLLGLLVRRREYVVRLLRVPDVVAEGTLHDHCCYVNLPATEKRGIRLLGDVLEENAVSTRSSDNPTSRVGVRHPKEEGR